MPKSIRKQAKVRSKAPPKIRLRRCTLCEARVQTPKQLCNKHETRLKTISGPNAKPSDKGIYKVL